jgi:hypothetical protein
MDMKAMIVSLVYLSPQGLLPLEIVEQMEKQYAVKTTTKKVIEIVESNRKILVEEQGRIKSPSNRSGK